MKLREIKQHHIPALITIFLLIIADIIAFVLSYYLVINVIDIKLNMKYPIRVLLLIILLMQIGQRYNPVATVSRSKDIKTILQIVYSVGIGYVIIKILNKSITIDQAQTELVFLHLFLLLDILIRLFIRTMQKFFLSKGHGHRKTIIIGSKTEALHIATELVQKPSLGYKLDGYFSSTESDSMNAICKYRGKIIDLRSYVNNNNIKETIIALNSHKHSILLEIISQLSLTSTTIKIIPDIYEAVTGQARVNVLTGIPLLDINPDIITELQILIKRIMDIFISGLGLIVLIPFNIFFAIIIKISSPGKFIYKQERMGKERRLFILYKFRTMYENSERDSGPVWASENDPRILPIGKILRKFRLDEIPQLFNVLKGEMSIVGPRPERVHFITELEKKIPYYNHRLRVKPGITGWAQVVGSYDKSVDDVINKLKLDFYYIENMSLMLDIKIIILTAWTIIRGKGL